MRPSLLSPLLIDVAVFVCLTAGGCSGLQATSTSTDGGAGSGEDSSVGPTPEGGVGAVEAGADGAADSGGGTVPVADAGEGGLDADGGGDDDGPDADAGSDEGDSGCTNPDGSLRGGSEPCMAWTMLYRCAGSLLESCPPGNHGESYWVPETCCAYGCSLGECLPGPGDGGGDGASDASGCTLAAPVLMPSGGYILVGGYVTITTSTVVPNVQIFCTTDGTAPNRTSLPCNGGLRVASSETIAAFAIAPGCDDSPIASGTYIATTPDGGHAAAIPMATPPPGSYQGDFNVSLTTATPGATICYSIDGTSPICAVGGGCSVGTAYNPATPIPVTALDTYAGSLTIFASACAAGMAGSEIAELTYQRR